jgi:HSP20 family protein
MTLVSRTHRDSVSRDPPDGTFERRFSLPENVNADSIRCESKEGILTVHIPKTETSKQKAKQITVQ